MTKIKLCGLSRPCDIEAANQLQPDYIGFVFAPKSKRCIMPEQAAELKRRLLPEIKAVGIFVNEYIKTIAGLLHNGTIDMVQLHGRETGEYIRKLRTYTDKPVIQAFRMETEADAAEAECSLADYILLDSGAGTGTVFDWKLLPGIRRPYFLAGGLDINNVTSALQVLHSFGVDVSSGIETNGQKDKLKMAAFVTAVRNATRKDV